MRPQSISLYDACSVPLTLLYIHTQRLMISHQHGNNLQGIRQSCKVRYMGRMEKGEK